ncbi:MAG: GNAT family N-acetyltransferase [Alphaproteobacteria bacterium]
MTGTWRRKWVPLRFRAGDIILFEPRIDVWESTSYFADIAPLETPGELPMLRELGGASGCLVRSQPTAVPLPAVQFANGFLRYVPQQYNRYVIDLTGTFETYLAKFSAKTRSTLKRKVRKFADASGGTIDWRSYRTPADIEAFHASARRLSERTYQERLLDAGLPDSEAFRSEMAALATSGEVRAYMLFLKGEPVGYLYCPVRRGVLIYEYLGYDPRVRDLSPGTVLQVLVLESLFAEGRFRAFDFTEGEGDHKRLFSTTSQYCADVFVLRPTARNLLLVASQLSLDKGSRAAAMVVERLGLKSRLKQWIRRLGRSPRPAVD